MTTLTTDLAEEFSVWSGGHEFDEVPPDEREWFADGRSEEDVRAVFADQPEDVLEGLVLRLAVGDEQ